MRRDPFIIDPDHDSDNDCQKCGGDGHLHKRPEGTWEGCLAHLVGGRCCDWERKVCPDCNGSGEREIKVATKD